jgi:hypothetical protein
VQEVGSVELIMALSTDYSAFSNQSSVFLSRMAAGLDILLSQVSLLEFWEENDQVIVRWVIAADPPEHQLSMWSAQVSHSLHSFLFSCFGSLFNSLVQPFHKCCG